MSCEMSSESVGNLPLPQFPPSTSSLAARGGGKKVRHSIAGVGMNSSRAGADGGGEDGGSGERSVSGAASGRRRPSFLHLNIPEAGGWRGSLTHLHLPTFSLTGPDGGGSPWFNFSGLGIRRHSHNTLHRSDSMVSLCYRSLANFINDDNFDGFQQFLQGKQVQVDDKDENGTTALMLAASKGRTQFARELLDMGADPNGEDSDNWTALLCAAKEGHVDICRLLLENHADIEHRDMGGWTSLMWATYKGRFEVLTLLLDSKADVNAHGNYHISGLLWASGRGYTQIVEVLLHHGSKVNMGDKYGTTALIWAARKGHTEIVRLLLRSGANVDTAGMYSWTALLVATQGNHEDIVNLLLDFKPNVNALDKDGCSALTIACKEGYYEIAVALMNSNAYINIQDRSGDTNLIHAVKGGHRGVVEALLKKYADVDVAGKDRKTAMYVAVEKGYTNIVKMLLSANPDLEVANKEGDTPLLKAVRCRNAEVVQLLLDKKAKVGAADKKGDTALHIAMRARSKAIVEILLRNPKHSHLLYRPNRAGETPYNIDVNHQKTIIGQIFGARRLNTNEDNENMLGYDLYSYSLADVLSEPSLSMPITVGLYAKWGSGKSFLLNKLREEMKKFARQWLVPGFQFTPLLFVVLLHMAMIIGTIVGLSTFNWLWGLSVGLSVLFLTYAILAFVWFASKHYDWDWPNSFNCKLTSKLNNLKLILQILFCHPPGASSHDSIAAQPISFYFTDQTRMSSTTGGENSVVQMIGSLYDAIENDYGSFVTRLYRAFKPRTLKSSSTWRWRKVCCVPYVIVFEVTFIFFLMGICALVVFLFQYGNNEQIAEMMTLQIILIIAAFILGIATLANLYTWSKMFSALIFSQRRHLQRTISRLDTLKSEGFLQALRSEVQLMTEMVKCLDALSSQQTRLVVVVDGLDSSEQDKVLLVLDAVHMLFSDVNTPFIVILAIDPHVISKAVELNSRRLFSESNIGGHGYLNNMVHLPFYLQNSGLRKFKEAQKTAHAHRKNIGFQTSANDDSLSITGRSLSARRLSSENALMSSTEKLSKFGGRKGSRKLKGSESIASSIGSNLNRIGGAQDLTKMLLTDDYFSDVNPRSMRRLMNVVYITGRLLKAFQIDFSWYRLASWINITEQWPFRTSWIIYHYDTCEDSMEDNYSLKAIYDKIRPSIPTLKDVEPLLELDRDERKFDFFLSYHKSTLLLSDLKVFLPFTINLDPYLKKVIKEEAQGLDESGLIITPHRHMNIASNASQWPQSASDWSAQRHPLSRRMRSLNRSQISPPMPIPSLYSHVPGGLGWGQGWADQIALAQHVSAPLMPHYPVTSIAPDILETKLSSLNVDGVCKLMENMHELSADVVQNYQGIVQKNNVNGRVLLHCDLEELKRLLQMSFGDWEMFKVVIVSLREQEMTQVLRQDEAKNVRFSIGSAQLPVGALPDRKGSTKSQESSRDEAKIQNDASARNKPSVIEKQVTLEEQMICGALQTLNEEACEDVLEETEENLDALDVDIPRTFVIHPSPDSSQEGNNIDIGCRSRANSACGFGETDFVILQTSPVGNWQPISISIQGTSEPISVESSRCSSPHQTPVLDRRSNNIKLNNLKSSEVSVPTSRSSKHVLIKSVPDPTKPMNKNNTVVYYDVKKKRPTSLVLKESIESGKSGSLHRNRSKSIDNPRRYHRKNFDKFLYSNPELNDTSDNESTPLVSDNSTPSKSFIQSHSSNSLALSVTSFQSCSPSSDLKTFEFSDESPLQSDRAHMLSASNISICSRASLSSLNRQDAIECVDVSAEKESKK